MGPVIWGLSLVIINSLKCFELSSGQGGKAALDVRYSVANEGEMFDIMNILDGAWLRVILKYFEGLNPEDMS